MVIFSYDGSFEGLLSALFDCYVRRTFPDRLLTEGEPLPLFADELHSVCTDPAKADRVWKGLQKRLSPLTMGLLTAVWLSELSEAPLLLLRYMRKVIDARETIEYNLGDPDVLAVAKIGRKVNQERLRVIQFLRFQKAVDGTYFAALSPLYNVLPLTIAHLQDRFADQRWLLYDLQRAYGYYYDLREATEVRFTEEADHLRTGRLGEALADSDEALFQQLWQTYFRSTAIRERLNPRLHRQHMPVRFWRFLIEKS